ncbi:IS4 family transposase [uncultured Muribaculum sp.]|uniref:IS4 family transposase n=1 Tax=uncultured Muribaculum sp. TaxID=1918613 RepID=UPI0025D30A07|nr:IS4 family transposase [uncultured Muribaculum sp.]
MQTPYILTQLMHYVDRGYFERQVSRYGGNRYVKTFSCWNMLSCLVWAQLSGARSLRDIVMCQNCHRDKSYRMGVGRNVSRNNLSNALAKRDVAMFRELASRMMERTGGTCIRNDPLKEIAEAFSIGGFFAADSTTVRLHPGRFGWTTVKQGWGGIKAHVLFDLLRYVPTFCLVTGHEEGDQTFMEDYPYSQGCMYLFDRVYNKPSALYHIHRSGARFIVRGKTDPSIEVVHPYSNGGEDRNVLADRKIRFIGPKSRKGYPVPLRQVLYHSESLDANVSFLTNDETLPADIVADIYHFRWDIEVFFKWLKQHLNIQAFYGQSANAVSIQVYVAIITLCIVALVASDHNVTSLSHYELSRVLACAITHRYWLPDLIRLASERSSNDGPNTSNTQYPSLFD